MAVVPPRIVAALLISSLLLGCDHPQEEVGVAAKSGPRAPSIADAPEPVVPPEVLAALDRCMEDVVRAPGVSGAAATLVADGGPLWLQGYGVVDPDRTAEVDADTLFRVGSVTKVMTATLAMTLVADERLDLEMSATDALGLREGEASTGGHPSPTLGELLSQQGGLADVFNINGPREDDALADTLIAGGLLRSPALTAPGEFYNYSNTNYAVAGLIAEQAAETPYRHAVRDRVFTPLGMSRSTFDVDTVARDGNYARGVVDGGIVLDAQAYDNGWARPAGFAWSSARDLGALVTFLQYGDPSVLPPLAHAELMSPMVDMNVLGRMHYGLGLVHSDLVSVDGGVLEYDHIEHNGKLPGYSALVHIVPELDVGFAFVANGNSVDFHPCVAAALEELPNFAQSATELDPQWQLTETDAFIGDYVESLPTVGAFSIARGELGELRVSMPTLDECGIPYLPELVPATRDSFYLLVDGGPILMTGIFGPDGSLEYLRTRHFVARPAATAPAGWVGSAPDVSSPDCEAGLWSVSFTDDASPQRSRTDLGSLTSAG